MREEDKEKIVDYSFNQEQLAKKVVELERDLHFYHKEISNLQKIVGRRLGVDFNNL